MKEKYESDENRVFVVQRGHLHEGHGGPHERTLDWAPSTNVSRVVPATSAIPSS